MIKKEKKIKNNKKNKKNKVVKDSYLSGVKYELKNASWPKFKDVIKYSAATIVLCLIMAGWFSILNLLLSFIKGVLV